MKKNYSFLLFLFINLVFTSCKSQNISSDKFNYYKIDLKSEETNISSLMRNNYKKEFYSNENVTIYKKQSENYLELMYFYKNGQIEKHLFKKNNHYVIKNYKYIDEGLSELSDSQKEELKNLYTIKKDDVKKINKHDCIKIIMKNLDSPESIEMYVTEEIPNLPIHFPLSSNVINGEPLEIKIYIFSEIIEFGVTEFVENIGIEKQLGISLNNPKQITESEYLKLTE